MYYILVENKNNPHHYSIFDALVLIGNAPNNGEFRSSSPEEFSNAFIEYDTGKVSIKTNPTGKDLLINGEREVEKVLEDGDIVEVKGAFSYIFFHDKDKYIAYLQKKLGIRCFDNSKIELTDKCNSKCK